MSRRGWLMFASMCVIWGIPYLLIKVAVRDLTPGTLVFFRTALSALLLLPIALHRGQVRPLARFWLPLLAFTLVEIAIPWILLAGAETRVSSSLTGLLIAAVPLVAALIMRTTGQRERLEGRRAAGLLLGMAGVAALVGLDVHGSNPAALVAIAGVVLGYAIGPIILTRYMRDLPGLAVIAVSLAASAVVYTPVAAVQWPSSMPSAKVIASVVVLSVVCTAIAFLIFFELIAEVGPVRASVFTYVNPAVAAILGVALLGETFTTGMGVGFVLVLAGSILATRPAPTRAESAPAPV
ncbi:MAG TPA: EamA family transporter [Gaiellaceae bacterium]